MASIERHAQPDGNVLFHGVFQRVVTFEDFVKAADIKAHVPAQEGDEWVVVKWEPRISEMGHKDADSNLVVTQMYHASALLKPVESSLLKLIRTQTLMDMEGHNPYTRIEREPQNSEPVMAVFRLMDLHIGMLAWEEETREDNWDLKEVHRVVSEAAGQLVSDLAGYNIELIIVPMGNDILHSDRPEGGTFKGTPLDIDSRYLKAFRRARKIMVELLDVLRLIADVKIVIVPGNHDTTVSQYLGEVMYAWYRNDPHVEVDASASLRKYHLYGQTFVGFTHGEKEDPKLLPGIMAAEEPLAWGASRYREIHCGHVHKERGIYTQAGVTIRYARSLTPPDAWHAGKGFVGGGRGADVILYRRYRGLIGSAVYSIPAPSGSIDPSQT